MIEQLAVVVKIDNHQVWVENSLNTACSGCQQKTSCSTNAISGIFKKKSVPVDCDIQLNVGDEVMIAIDESLLLRASLLLYFAPLMAFFTGAGIADYLLDSAAYSELWIFGSAVLSFLAALWLINKLQSRWILNYYARPVVISHYFDKS